MYETIKNDRIRGHELRGMGIGKLFLLKHKVSLQIGVWEKMEGEGGRNYVNIVVMYEILNKKECR